MKAIIVSLIDIGIWLEQLQLKTVLWNENGEMFVDLCYA